MDIMNTCKCGTKLTSKGNTVKEGKIYKRYHCKSCSKSSNEYYTELKDEIKNEENLPKVEKFLWSEVVLDNVIKKYDKFVITSAINNTSYDKNFYASLLKYCHFNHAKLFIIPVRYNNPNAFHPNEKLECEWPEELKEHFIENTVNLGENIKILADFHVTATSSNPLSGLERLCKGKTIIFGHSQLQMKSCPRLDNQDPIIITTTGSISTKNYSDSKAGYFANENHKNSAVIVEMDRNEGIFHLRHLVADSVGSFYDLDYYYTPNRIAKNTRIAALIPGDEHVIINSKKVYSATYSNENSIVNVLKPEKIVRHDLLDSYSINYHDDKDFYKRYYKSLTYQDNLFSELFDTKNFIEETSDIASQYGEFENIIVDSNHSDHLLKWMNDPKSSLDVKNAAIYTELRSLMMEDMRKTLTSKVNPFKLYVKNHINPRYKVKFLEENTSYKINGVEVSIHGHNGTNGSRGSPEQYSKLGIPMITGHGHSPSINKECWTMGTSTDVRLEYANGPTSNLNTHAIIHQSRNYTID